MHSQASQLLPVEAITPELLNQVAKTFFDEDRAGVMPEWWPAVMEAAREACVKEVDEGFLETIKSGIRFIEDNGGVNPLVIGGLILKAVMIGWRLADIYLTQQLEKTAN